MNSRGRVSVYCKALTSSDYFVFEVRRVDGLLMWVLIKCTKDKPDIPAATRYFYGIKTPYIDGDIDPSFYEENNENDPNQDSDKVG